MTDDLVATKRWLPMQEKTRAAVRAALMEASFVVLGVVLALAANEWREARVDRREAAAALASITEELASNRSAVASSLEYHDALLAMLQRSRTDGTALDADRFTRGFVSPAQLHRTGWESASETGVLGHMEYATVLHLARAYAQQARYEEQARSVGEIIYGEYYRGGAEALLANPHGLASLIGTFAYRERQLLESYDRTAGPSDARP